MTKTSTCPSSLRDGQSFIFDPKQKADLLNSYFQSVSFKDPDNLPQHENIQRSPHRLPVFVLSTAEVYEALKNIDPSKACGPDNLPGRILTEVAGQIAPSFFTKLFNQSLTDGQYLFIKKTIQH